GLLSVARRDPPDALLLLRERLEPLAARIDAPDPGVARRLFVDQHHELICRAALGRVEPSAVELIHVALRYLSLGHAGVELIDLGAVVLVVRGDEPERVGADPK